MRTYELFQPGELRELHPEESTPAEKEGVEPSRLFTLVGFQDRCHRPLACLSKVELEGVEPSKLDCKSSAQTRWTAPMPPLFSGGLCPGRGSHMRDPGLEGVAGARTLPHYHSPRSGRRTGASDRNRTCTPRF